MGKINSLLVLSALSVSLNASPISVDSLGINYLYNNSSTNQENKVGTINLSNEPDEDYNGYEIFSIFNTSYDDKTLKPYLSYSNSTNDEFEHQYILVGINKYYNSLPYDIYLGIVAGYGELTWKYDPVGSSTVDNKGVSYILGVQTGASFVVSNNLNLNLSAKYLAHRYQTKLSLNSTQEAQINHNDTLSLGLGISYIFEEKKLKKAPLKQKVEESSKEISQKSQIDKDRDGVIDNIDICSNTPSNVNTKGCIFSFKEVVMFESSSAKLEESENNKINELVSLIVSKSDYDVIIEAHTDSSGQLQDNLKLSQKRAKSLYNRLIMMGISSSRLSYMGYGDSKPLVSNETYQGRTQNRRIEVRFVKR